MVKVPVILVFPQTSSLLVEEVAPIPTLPSTYSPLLGAVTSDELTPIPTLPDTPSLTLEGVVEVPIPTLPDTPKLPDRETLSFKFKVMDPPKATSPPPVRLVPAETVNLPLDKAEFGILVNVLEDPDIVLLVKVWVKSIPTRVVVPSGKVIVLSAVGTQVSVPAVPPEPKAIWLLVAAKFKESKLGEDPVDRF